MTFEPVDDSRLGNPPNGSSIGTYCLLSQLGQGTFATVWSAIGTADSHCSPVGVALKVFPSTLGYPAKKAALHAQRILSEMAILEKVQDHPNIIPLFDFVENRNEGRTALVFPLIKGGNLEEFLEHSPPQLLAPELVFQIFFQLVCAADHCHAKGVAHRDIKPANVLLDETHTHVWLTDFGLATTENPVEHAVGSPYYLAPELVAARFKSIRVNPFISDIWAVGVLLFRLLAAKLPFEGSCQSQLYTKIAAAKYTIPSQVDSDHARDLLRSLLEPTPERRIGLDAIRAHPWWVEQCTTFGIDPDAKNLMPTMAPPAMPLSVESPSSPLPEPVHESLASADRPVSLKAIPPPPLPISPEPCHHESWPSPKLFAVGNPEAGSNLVAFKATAATKFLEVSQFPEETKAQREEAERPSLTPREATRDPEKSLTSKPTCRVITVHHRWMRDKHLMGLLAS